MLCSNCLDYIPELKPPLCRFCGRPIKKGKTCRSCKDQVYIDYGRAWTLFIPPVDKIVHHFKYRKKTKLAKLFGQAMASIIKFDHILKNVDIIIPVPLYWWKYLRRGYNQAALLSKIIAEEGSAQVANIMQRIKNTKTQTRLNEEARRKNVFNAFTVKLDSINDKRVLLIDDVLTTGATMNECARILKEAGAKRVYSCVATITPG